jgi:hypothetical protein
VSDSHWDKAIKASQDQPQEGEAPPLPDMDLEEAARQIGQAAMNSNGPPSSDAIDSIIEGSSASERRESEREDRKNQYEVDKWEARAEGISVGELRQRRHDESKRGGDPEQPEEVAEPVAAAEEDAEPQVQMVELLRKIAEDVAQIKEGISALADEDAHG